MKQRTYRRMNFNHQPFHDNYNDGWAISVACTCFDKGGSREVIVWINAIG